MSNKAVHMLMLGLVLASTLVTGTAPARAVTVTNGIPSQAPPLSVIDGTATFDLINFNTNHQIISNWTEGGMRFTCPPGIYAHGGSFIPPGFTDQNFYFDTGVFGLYGMQRANGEAFSALQFDTAHTGGGVWDYIWMVVRLQGQTVSSYDLNIQMQLGPAPANRITITGLFDEVRLFGSSDAGERDAHPSSGVLNAIAIDSVTFTAVPEPSAACAGMFLLACVSRRRRT